MNRLLAAAVTAICFAGSIQNAACQAVADQAFITAIRAMKHSVTPVSCMRTVSRPAPQANSSSPEPASVQYDPVIDGTAFFISGRGDFITAAHVVDDFAAGKPLANCPLSVWYEAAGDRPGSFNGVAFVTNLSDCVEDRVLDIARCRTIDDLTKLSGGKYRPTPVEFDTNQREDGTPIAITGFPLSNIQPISSRGYIGGYPPSSRGPVLMILDRAVWPGGSGSPVYDSRGKVLGMVLQAGEGAASGIAGARTSFAIGGFLAAHPAK